MRQLKNLIERIVLLEEGTRLDPEHLPPEILDAANGAPTAGAASSMSLAQIEERHIRQIMRMTDGNKSRAARILGISRPTLIERLKRMGGDLEDVRDRS